MHDWTLVSVEIDWATGVARLNMKAPFGSATIRALELREMRIPRTLAWGPSISVNSMNGPSPYQDGFVRLSIEMQTGDLIELTAKTIEMPEA